MNTETNTDAGKVAPAATCSGFPCDCQSWACADFRDIMRGNGHHPRCQHYAPKPPDPRLAQFGALMWQMILDHGSDFCGNEISEEILLLAQASGLCCRVEYDPEKHGSIDCDPGDEIWWWGDYCQNVRGQAPG